MMFKINTNFNLRKNFFDEQHVKTINLAKSFHMMHKQFLLFLIFFLLMPNIAFAIGITPSSKQISFTSDLFTDSFVIENNENKSIDILLYKDGELSKYVFFSEDIYTLEPWEKKSFQYILNLPFELKPGKHRLALGAMQIAKEEGGLSAITAAEMLLFINVPYPPRYLETSISIFESETENIRNINISVSSLGNESVIAKGRLNITDYFGEMIYEKDLGEKAYFPGTNIILEEKISTENFTSGKYEISADFKYELESMAEKEFTIGEPEIEVIEIKKDIIKQGDIWNISIDLHNKFKGNVSDVYAKLHIKNKTIETEPVKAGALENFNIIVSFNTSAFEYGIYKTNLTVFYEKNSITREIELLILPKNIEILIASGVIFFAIISSVLFIHFRRKKK